MIISPSLLAADFANLGREVEMINHSNADWIHLDVMDGVFVPNISFGFPIIKSVSKYARKPLDVHLMVVNPQNYVNQVRDCGAELMNIHLEACTHLCRTVDAIRTAGMRPAVTLNPSTPVSLLEDIISDVDMVLLMSVNPGFGGQKFIENTIKKVKRLRALIAQSGSKALIEIDGGVNLNTGRRLAEAGADVLVSGNFIFSSDNPAEAIDKLKKL